MKKINSYNLNRYLTGVLKLKLVKILSVKEIRQELIIYAIEDEDYPVKKVKFETYCTGSQIDEYIVNYEYLSTIWIENMGFHVFYKIIE